MCLEKAHYDFKEIVYVLSLKIGISVSEIQLIFTESQTLPDSNLECSFGQVRFGWVMLIRTDNWCGLG